MAQSFVKLKNEKPKDLFELLLGKKETPVLRYLRDEQCERLQLEQVMIQCLEEFILDNTRKKTVLTRQSNAKQKREEQAKVQQTLEQTITTFKGVLFPMNNEHRTPILNLSNGKVIQKDESVKTRIAYIMELLVSDNCPGYSMLMNARLRK